MVAYSISTSNDEGAAEMVSNETVYALGPICAFKFTHGPHVNGGAQACVLIITSLFYLIC
ncbi:conserved hypothetical protein [Xenorhabdus bovienii str. kraussei Quebec]|uniref:Uncharacterized protein n=1 Tax=Xenorhabdus bovienii str. kraussei Quebec TaxID=1398203 RepID=A0A077PHI8_XENBV|nr:conserved hypothetical protein [Xenorhabdus bovienii str. kraussei Quebec]